ncbi:uncharacterized protein [Antedon mediterranea]|uniref:uncharacterized protein n=1 Tax=Antedon mediterranea TaxID=105859 RepID=UPI003AF40C5B
MDISTLLLHTTFIVVILLLHGIFGAAILNCPTNLTSSSSVVDYGDKVYTTDPDRYTIACVPEIGQNVADGTHVVICNAWQGFQYLDICRFHLIVDTKVPNITCPSNQLNSSSTIYYDVISTDDVDTSPSVECSPQSGSNFSEGVTTVLCSAWDYAKNNASCNFTVTIVPSSKTVTIATDATFNTPPVVSTISGPKFTEEVTPVYVTNEPWNDSVTTICG